MNRLEPKKFVRTRLRLGVRWQVCATPLSERCCKFISQIKRCSKDASAGTKGSCSQWMRKNQKGALHEPPSERGCVEDQPQRVATFGLLRLVPLYPAHSHATSADRFMIPKYI